MYNFLGKYSLLKLTPLEIENLKRPGSKEEIENVIQELSYKKMPGPESFTGKLYQTSKDQMVPVLYELFQSIEEGNFLIFFIEQI